MECTLETSEIVGDTGFFSIGDYCTRSPDYIYAAITGAVDFAKDFFSLSHQAADKLAETFDVSALGFGFVCAIGDSLEMVKSSLACVKAAKSGFTSSDFFDGVKDVVHDFGCIAMDAYEIAEFLSTLKIVKLVTPFFRSFALGAMSVTYLIKIKGNVSVLSQGDKPKETLSDVKKGLVKLDYKKNQFALTNNIISLAVTILGLAGIILCSTSVFAVAFLSLGLSFQEYFQGREMQKIVTDAALGIK